MSAGESVVCDYEDEVGGGALALKRCSVRNKCGDGGETGLEVLNSRKETI